MDGCIAVTKVDHLRTLMRYICRNGFEHHVAMCRGDVAEALQEAVENYLGWKLYVHN
jgi:L-fucose isomerase-like protein